MVYILLAEGFEEAEALIPADLLRRAGLPVSLVGLNAATVAGGHGIAVAADLTLEQVVLSSQDMLLLPGGKGGVESMQMDLFALALIQKAHTVGCYLAAICAAPTLLAHLGLLDRRSAVCYPGMEAHYDESTNPTCVYIEPEAASVGLTEEQAKAQGIDYMVGKFPMSANGKALILNGGEGLVKIIAGREYGEVLGMHIIGPRATDLIAEGALAIRLEATIDELISTIHSHPTVTETMRECALDALGRAVHIPPRRK